jgi:hypothetical protein
LSPDPAAVADPLFVLSTWAGGVALAGAAVTARRVVGPGFTWLAAAVVGLIGLWSVIAGSVVASIALALTAVGGGAVRRSRGLASAALAAAGALLAATGIILGGPVLALTALVALGGITAEMMLGHWYLVDPTLSRGVLRALAGAGIVGAVADPLAVHALYHLPASFGVGVHWALAITTVLLMVGVLGALRHPAYSGVMAATGLSYLAVLTGLAAVFVGRLIAAGAGPFA